MKKAFLGVIALLPLCAFAQTFTLSETSPYVATRFGMNFTGNDYYQDFILKNLTSANPGFQPQIVAQVQNVATTGTTSSFTAGNVFDQVPANWWSTNGGTFYVAYGSNAGCSGTITANTTANQSSTGVTFTLSPACSHNFATYDVIYTYIPPAPTLVGNINFNNFFWNVSGVTVDSTSGDLPPAIAGFQPVQVMQVASGGSLQTAFDTTGGQLFYNFNGTYTAGLHVYVVSGTPTVTFSIQRSGGINTSCNFSPSGASWNSYTCSFTGSESTSITQSNVSETWSVSGGTVRIIGSTVTANADNNSSVFRNQVVNDFGPSGMNLGECRYWTGQNGETLNNWLTPQIYRSTSGASQGNPYSFGNPLQMGLHDFLVFAAANCGGQVWIEVPIAWKAGTDAANLQDYLGGNSGTTYGAIRIALGQTTPWTSVFSRIVLEYGNEIWNQAASGQSMPYNGVNWAYLNLVVPWCAALKADASWNSTVEKCAAGIQTGGSFWSGQLEAIDTSHEVDIQANNFYGSNVITSYTSPQQWVSAWTEAWAAGNDPTNSTYAQTYGSSPQTSQYEGQNNTVAGNGSITQAAATGYPEGEGYAVVDALWPLWLEKKYGSVDENFFAYTQNGDSFHNNSGNYNIAIWGIKTGVGGAYNNPRPSYYAWQVADNCIGSLGVGWPVAASSIPTYSFSAINGVPSESSVPYLQAFEFKQTSTSRCMVVLNLDPTASHSFSVSGTNSPTGTVTVTTLSAAALTTSNEGANGTVNVQPATITVSNPTSFTLAAHALASISWSVGSTPQPPIGISGIVTQSGLITNQ